MPARGKTLRERTDAALLLGFEIIEVERMRGTHVKIHMRYKGEEFFFTTSSAPTSTPSARRNYEANLKTAKKAIDTDDPVLKAKFMARAR